jgi:hypothetical protein
MYLQRKFFLALVLSVAAGLSGCGATTSSDAMEVNIGRAFNVTGDWAGEFKDAIYGTHEIYLTLNDSGGSVTGTVAIPTHICLGFDGSEGLLGEYWLSLEGTATQMPEGTAGDNPFTSVQENSNSGSLDFQNTTLAETITINGEDQTFDRYITFNLTGTSDSLSGKFSGTWIGPGLNCRTGIQGAIVITRS